MNASELLNTFEDWLGFFQFCQGKVKTVHDMTEQDVEELQLHLNAIHDFLLNITTRARGEVRLLDRQPDKLDYPIVDLGKREIEMNPTMRRDCPELIYLDTNLLHSEEEVQEIKTPEAKRNHQRSYVRGKYNKYTTFQKHSAVAMLEQGKKLTEISRELGIPAKNIRRWKQEGITRKSGAGRRIKDIEMQLNLRRWLLDQWRSGAIVSCKEIKNMARTFSTNSEFRASKGWLQKFVDRTRRISQQQPI